jgi:hypothetical protein
VAQKENVQAKLKKRLAEEAEIEQERQHAAAEDNALERSKTNTPMTTGLRRNAGRNRTRNSGRWWGSTNRNSSRVRKEEAEVHYKEWLRDITAGQLEAGAQEQT